MTQRGPMEEACGKKFCGREKVGFKVWQGLSWGGVGLGCGKSGWKAYRGNGTKLLPNVTRKGKAA